MFKTTCILLLLAAIIAGCGRYNSTKPHTTIGKTLYEDSFENLDNWHFEGLVEGVSNPKSGIMRLDCNGSQQGQAGCMSFCRKDFPDNVCIEYDLYVEEKNGLVITFIAMQGLNGQDAITGVPPRTGVFSDYVGDNASTRSYHVSVSRYDDNAVHTGVSNWRRNPGLHLMGQGDDPCREIKKWYHIRITKSGAKCQMFVNGKLASEFTDPQTINDKIPTSGKIGFRLIGSRAVAQFANFKVRELMP